jgi:hypothetical protein
VSTLPPWLIIVFVVVLVALGLLRIFLPRRGQMGQTKSLFLIVRVVLFVVLLGVLAWRFWSGQHH